MFARGGATSNAVVAATSNAVAYPSTLLAGDLLIFVAVISSNPAVGADPSGFASQASLASSAATLTVRCYLRIADGTESGSATVTWTGAQNSVAAMVAIQGYTGVGSIVLDPVAVVGVSSGATYNRAGGTASASGGKADGAFAIVASTNTTGISAITLSSPHTKIAEVYGGTTPFLGLAIADFGVLQVLSSTPTLTGTDTRTTTANFSAQFGVQLPYPSSYSPNVIPGAALNLESRAVIITAQDIPGAPLNLEFIAAAGSGSAAWPASGQGWPRIKQG